jgi:hypothetical protein
MDWVSLVECRVDVPEVADVLKRHSVSLKSLQWIHGMGRAALPDAGVRLLLWKTGVGKPGVIDVMGVEFVLSGMRGGKPFDGALPHGVVASDSLQTIGRKVQPAMLLPAATPDSYEALWPEHRFVVNVTADEQLKSCTWISTRERSRRA